MHGLAPTRRTAALLLALLALLLSACGQADDDGGRAGTGGTPTGTTTVATATPAGSTPTPTASATAATPPAGATATAIAHPTGADELVLQIVRSGGLAPAALSVTELPLLAVYGDGTVITLGAEMAIFPGPALPPVLQSKLTEEGLQALLRRARDAGLMDGDASYFNALVTDMPTTVFTLSAGGRTTTVSAYALDFEEVGPDATEAERLAREALRAFQSEALAFWSWLPAADVPEREAPYRFKQLQVVSQPAAQDLGNTGVVPDEQDWPLPESLATLGVPYVLQQSRCFVVAGAELDQLLPHLEQATDITRWHSDGQDYVLFLRPLLPHETGCPNV